jgi:voltage-gated sodium channel
VQRLRLLVTSDGFRSAILFLILLNAFAMGLEASPDAADGYQTALEWVFLVSQVIFVAEIAARWLVTPRGEFFRDSWNRYDFVIVALSLMPAVGEFVLVARILRVLRVVRIVSVSDALWGSVLRRHSGLRAVTLALVLVLLSGYVFALAGFHLFGDDLPQWASLAQSVSSLVRSLTPGGLAAALKSSSALLVFHAVFYVALLSIAVNLGASLLRTSRGASS